MGKKYSSTKIAFRTFDKKKNRNLGKFSYLKP